MAFFPVSYPVTENEFGHTGSVCDVMIGDFRLRSGVADCPLSISTSAESSPSSSPERVRVDVPAAEAPGVHLPVADLLALLRDNKR